MTHIEALEIPKDKNTVICMFVKFDNGHEAKFDIRCNIADLPDDRQKDAVISSMRKTARQLLARKWVFGHDNKANSIRDIFNPELPIGPRPAQYGMWAYGENEDAQWKPDDLELFDVKEELFEDLIREWKKAAQAA